VADAFDVVVVGSANLDLVATTSRIPGPGETVLGRDYAEYPGGKGLNQAVAAARSGSDVAFVASVGDDEAGRRLLATATHDGVDVTAVEVVSDNPTGRALITVDEHAENCIVVVPGANGHRFSPALPGTRVVLAQLEVPADVVIHALRSARAAGALTVLNPAPAQDLPSELLAVCDVIVPNEHEIDRVGGVDHLHEAGVDAVVITRGARGVDVSVRSTGRRWTRPPFTVEVVDTTGAGDAFCGALAARLALGDPLAAAVEWGAAAGALATTVAGAVPSLPCAAAIRALLGPATVDGAAGVT